MILIALPFTSNDRHVNLFAATAPERRLPATRFPLAPAPRASLDRLGREGEPLLAIDALLADPAALVEAAAATPFAPAHGPAGGYPGLRAPAPLDYVEAVARALLPLMVEAFALPPGIALRRAECNFSLVTLPPDRLHATQRAPHVDTTDPWQFAILHYLCDAGHGGTAFYRHRATGYETLDPTRLPAYDAARAREGAGTGYVAGDDAWFTEIGRADAAPNRLVAYRSRLLHSGVIADPARLSADPRAGRLTANIFLTLGLKR